jgi:hypothetical protein
MGSLERMLPLYVTVLLLLMIGTGAAFLSRLLLSRILPVLRFNRFCERAGFSDFLKKGEVGYTPSQLTGVGAFWGILFATFLYVAHLLDLGVYETFVRQVASRLPRLGAALLILGIGFLSVSFLGNFVRTVARNAGIAYASLASRVTKWLGWTFVLLIALEQIQLGTGLVGTTFLILMTALALASALAFGIGCKDMARETMEKFLANLREKHRDRGDSDLEG